MTQWADVIENAEDDLLRIPPVTIIMYRDLFVRAWGWERLLPKVHGSVDCDIYKKYLEEYSRINATKVADGKDALHAAAKKCIEAENKLIMGCYRHLTDEALSLSSQIKDRAKDLIESDVEYPAAAVALLCITTEAELMYEFLNSRFQITETVAFSSKVRQSASNLMLYKGPESAAAAAGAMLGIATEARIILDSIYQEGVCPGGFFDYFAGQRLRMCSGFTLTELEQELACKTAGDAGTPTDSTKGFTTGDLNCEESCSMGNSKREMDGTGEEKTDTTEEVQEGTNEVKDAAEDELRNSENDTKGQNILTVAKVKNP